jgi:hypothetical protein
MIHVRRSAIVLTGLVTGLLIALAAAPAAYAMPVPMPDDGGRVAAAPIAAHHGPAGWGLGALALTFVLFVAGVAALALFVRARRGLAFSRTVAP